MKITIDIPKSKIKQYVALVSIFGTADDAPDDDEIEQIASTPEVDITEICNADKDYYNVALSVGLTAVAAIASKIVSTHDGDNS
ncbi:MAG: hypothetical protein K2H98_09355 [Duncaniella sp.]|nr:hypothetical protein [Duncaniella sp.]